jgi:hypothetical protein
MKERGAASVRTRRQVKDDSAGADGGAGSTGEEDSCSWYWWSAATGGSRGKRAGRRPGLRRRHMCEQREARQGK